MSEEIPKESPGRQLASKAASAKHAAAQSALRKGVSAGAGSGGGKIKPTAGSAATTATKQVTDKLAKRTVKSTDLSTEQGRKKAEAAELASEVVSGAVGGAAQGATKGGWAGAAAGAALGAGKALVQNPKGRNGFIVVIAALLVMSLAPMVLITAASTEIVGALSSSEQADQSSSIQSIESTITDKPTGDSRAAVQLVTQAKKVATQYPEIPWQLIAAALHELGEPAVLGGENTLPTFKLRDVSEGIEKRDPDALHRDLAEGALRNGNDPTQHLYLVETKDGGNPEAWGTHQETKEIITASLVDGGTKKSEAELIWDTALSWSLGISSACETPNQDSNAGSDGAGQKPGTSLEELSKAQISNAKSIMGMAKGIFGENWKSASVIALLTSMQESKLQVAANDGVIKNVFMPDGSLLANETGRTAEFPLTAYPIVAKSQKYPHQFVGSMYLTMGLFQQMANQGWSTLGNNTWESDPEAAVARLMDPSFSAFAFFRGLKDKVPNWQNIDPITAAEIVQVSGMGENTRKWKELAEQIVEKYGPDSPKIASPDEKASGNATETISTPDKCEVDVAPPGDSTGEVGKNGWAWPTDSRTVLSSYHLGMSVDLGSTAGGPMYASYSGVVIRAGGDGQPFGGYCPTYAWWRGENQTVMIKANYQGQDLYISLNHVGQVSVKVGQTVKAGQQIASEGMSGCTSGPHNHFFIASAPLYNGNIEPFQYIGRP